MTKKNRTYNHYLWKILNYWAKEEYFDKSNQHKNSNTRSRNITGILLLVLLFMWRVNIFDCSFALLLHANSLVSRINLSSLGRNCFRVHIHDHLNFFHKLFHFDLNIDFLSGDNFWTTSSLFVSLRRHTA